jgi:hypothetical protein
MNSNSLRSRLAPAAAFAAIVAVGTAQAAEMTLFKQPNFTGEALTLRGDSTNLGKAGFNDQASSIVVKSGRWQLCTQPDFNGDCVVLDRGDYPTLEQRLNHRVESVREVERYAGDDRQGERNRGGRYREDAYADGRGFRERDRSRDAAVELFAAPAFRGGGLLLDRDADTLASLGLDGRVSSLVVREGRWQACTRPGFEGLCRVFEPGRYGELGRFDNRIESLRRVG